MSAPSDVVWYISREGQRFGPLSADEFANLEDQSRLRPTDQVWQTGMDGWIAYSDLDARKAAARFAGKHRPTIHGQNNVRFAFRAKGYACIHAGMDNRFSQCFDAFGQDRYAVLVAWRGCLAAKRS